MKVLGFFMQLLLAAKFSSKYKDLSQIASV